MIKDIIVHKGEKLFYIESYADATFNSMLCAFKLNKCDPPVLKIILFEFIVPCYKHSNTVLIGEGFTHKRTSVA